MHQWAPARDPTVGGPLVWLPDLEVSLCGCEFILPALTVPDGRRYDVRNAVALVQSPDGAYVYGDKKDTLAQFTHTLAAASGLSVEWLKARKLTGSHIWRKAGGLIAELLGWPERDGCTVGDWSPPSDGGATPAAPSAAAKKAAPRRKQQSVRKRHYTPHFSRGEQLLVRDRYFEAVVFAFAWYGVENITPETQWSELFPSPPPYELASFYGPRPKVAASAGPAAKTKAKAGPKPPSAGAAKKQKRPAPTPAPTPTQSARPVRGSRASKPSRYGASSP